MSIWNSNIGSAEHKRKLAKCKKVQIYWDAFIELHLQKKLEVTLTSNQKNPQKTSFYFLQKY